LTFFKGRRYEGMAAIPDKRLAAVPNPVSTKWGVFPESEAANKARSEPPRRIPKGSPSQTILADSRRIKSVSEAAIRGRRTDLKPAQKRRERPANTAEKEAQPTPW